MATPALISWQTTRRARIDNLVEVYSLTHRLTTESHAEKVLWALVLRLAAEFQGFPVTSMTKLLKGHTAGGSR